MGARPLKVDLHTHILPERWPDLEARYGYSGFVRLEPCGADRARMMRGDQCFREVGANTWDPGRRLEECDRHGVDVQVLSTVPVMFSYWARPRDALEVSRLLNDHIAAVVAERPSRFAGLGTLPMQDPDLALGELERCLGPLGLAGVQIGSHVNDWDIDRPELFPLFRRAEELGAAVFVHPWDMLGAERMSRYWLRWLVGMPTETTLAICSVIFSGLLDRVPRLRIGFAHGGGALPATIGRLDHGHRVRPDLCAIHTAQSPRSYLGRLYFDALVHDADVLRLLVRQAGAARVAMGSDYPFPLGEPVPGRLIESIEEFDDAQRERLLGGTALEFLGLARSRFDR